MATKSSKSKPDEPEDTSGPKGYDPDAKPKGEDDEGNEADIEGTEDEPGIDSKDYVSMSTLRDEAAEIYDDCSDAFVAKKDRDDDNAKYWDIYNCKLGDQQSYAGVSEVFVPVVRDAIEARTLRFSNAMFPTNGRFVECISATNDNAHALQALINHYVRDCKLRETTGAMLRAGDVTGQYSLYVGWTKKERTIMQRVVSAPKVEIQPGLEAEAPGEEVEDIQEVTLSYGSPDVWVIPDEDLAVLPATVDDIDDADTVCVAIRVTKSWLRERKKEFTAKKYKQALGMFDTKTGLGPERVNPEKERAKDAGVKSEKGAKMLLLYQIWTSLEIKGKWTKVMIYAAGRGPENILSIKKNPYWGQRAPVLSAPIKKVGGSFWGISPTKPVEQLQYQANDAINMGMDSAQYALTPIVMSDPVSNPRVGTMVLEMAALWEVDPNKTKILDFPKLWQDALSILSAVKAQIHESLGLNPAMMPSGSTKKTSQAAVAQEQQLALEGTSDSVRTAETSILTPLANRIFEYDQQYRDKDLDIAHFGELGYEAEQEKVPPVSFGTRYSFQWNGVAQNLGQQRVQQMIAGMNVLRGVPPDQLNGRQLDIGPILDAVVDVIYGPRLGPRVLKDVRGQMGLPPTVENNMMRHNMPATVNPLDNDVEHIQMHHRAAAMIGDPSGIFQQHIAQHQKQLAMKAQKAAGAPGGQQGAPGGGPPGIAGTPRPGAMPAGPRPNAQQPPGAVRPGQMSDPSRMPAGHA
jgi:hypothetical protein